MKRNVKIIIIIIAIIFTGAVTISLKFVSKPSHILNNTDSKNSDVVTLDDYWSITTPEEEGIDSELLDQADKYLETTNAASFVVVKNANLIYENYYNNMDSESLNNIYSATKSITSALIGIAIDKKYIESIDKDICEYMPDYFQTIEDKRKKDITLKHLLTMTGGFYSEFSHWRNAQDMSRLFYNIEIEYEPGTHYAYTGLSTHLLSIAINSTCGMVEEKFADKYLFNKLGINKKIWWTDLQGNSIGSTELFLRPRDMAKIGLLYLRDGNWEGEQLISKEWVDESTKKHISTNESEINDPDSGYGYQWWAGHIGSNKFFYAAGSGGQYICVLKELDMVIVLTAIKNGEGKEPDLFTVLKDYILLN